MATLHVGLDDGFTGDEVLVRVNGQEVYRGHDVRTNVELGLADSFFVPRPESDITRVEVTLPLRGSTCEITLSGDAGTDAFVHFSRSSSGEVEARQDAQPSLARSTRA